MDRLDPKPSRQRKLKRLDKRLTDGIHGKPGRKVLRSGKKRRLYETTQWGYLPPREAMKEHHRDWDDYFRGKYLPIKNYLLRQVGRNWNEVYQELNEKLAGEYRGSRPLIGRTWWFVLKRVILEDGKLYNGVRRYGHYTDHPLEEGKLYIHPVSNILCRHQLPQRTQGSRDSAAKKRREKRKRKYLQRQGKSVKPVAGVLSHPSVGTKEQVITEGQTYDLLLRAGPNRIELRVRLSSLRPQEYCPENMELDFRFRKGQLPAWLPNGEDADGHYIRLLLYPNEDNNLRAKLAGAFPRVNRQELLINILPAGKLSLLP
ncbi:MAG: hypothetical protein AAGA31_03355 [Bacteroidota bacterium]